MFLYPVNLHIASRLCIVLGGGSVALRKVKGLLAADGRVRVVSPAVGAELESLAASGTIEWLRRGYVEGDLQRAFLAIAATNDCAVQEQIKREAERSSVLLNCADDPQGSDFHIPAHFRRGQMLITVSTGGGSPALAKQVRERLEKEIGPEYEAVVDLLAIIRERMVGGLEKAETNSDLFGRLLRLGVVDLLLQGDWFELQMLLLRELPAEVDAVALVRQFLEKHDNLRR